MYSPHPPVLEKNIRIATSISFDRLNYFLCMKIHDPFNKFFIYYKRLYFSVRSKVQDSLLIMNCFLLDRTFRPLEAWAWYFYTNLDWYAELEVSRLCSNSLSIYSHNWPCSSSRWAETRQASEEAFVSTESFAVFRRGFDWRCWSTS